MDLAVRKVQFSRWGLFGQGWKSFCDRYRQQRDPQDYSPASGFQVAGTEWRATKNGARSAPGFASDRNLLRPAGNIYVADADNYRIREIDGPVMNPHLQERSRID